MPLKELQDKLFELLCVVDEICTKEGVKYFVDSGTEIGAVREKNIIPWDDDLDMKVLREDYPKLKEAMQKNLPEGYKFIEPEEFSPYFYDFVPRIINTEWPIRPETDESLAYKSLQNRVGIDVFIFDRAPSSKAGQRMMMFKCKMIHGMAMSKRYKVKSEKYSFSEKILSGGCMLIGKLFSLEKIFAIHEKTMAKYNEKYSKKKSGYRIPSNYIFRDMRAFPEDIYEGVEFGEIRGRKFPVPSGYDKELTMIYGDYMSPPKDMSIYKNHLESD